MVDAGFLKIDDFLEIALAIVFLILVVTILRWLKSTLYKNLDNLDDEIPEILIPEYSYVDKPSKYISDEEMDELIATEEY